MSALAETVATALALSALAAACLKLLPHAPPRLKFAIAVAGMGAWLVPWGAVRTALPEATLAMPLADALAAAGARASLATGTWPGAGALLATAAALASLAGLALFARDCAALRARLRAWRVSSKAADGLRALLPPELAAVPAEIRVVADSSVAAASGWRKRTVWIGDRHTGERLRLVIVHEMTHARCRDPLWMGAIAALRRVYWWNPLVRHLARQAVLMLEATCDARSAAHFDEHLYAGELAAIVLEAAAPAPGLIAALQAKNLDVQRLRMLRAARGLRLPDLVAVAALGAASAAVAMTGVVTSPAASAPRASPPAAALAAPEPGNAAVLDDLLENFAFTPQQLRKPDAAR